MAALPLRSLCGFSNEDTVSARSSRLFVSTHPAFYLDRFMREDF